MKQFGIRLDDLNPARETVFVSKFEHFLFDLQRFVISEANDWWNGLEKRLVDVDIRFSIDGVICKVQELNYARLLVSLVKETSSCKLFFDQLTRGQSA